MEKLTGRKRPYNALSSGSDFYANDGFRFDFSCSSPAPTAVSSPASSVSSFSKVFSFAKVLAPSILTRNGWLGSSPAATATLNGSNSSRCEKLRLSSRHPLGLDAYLSNDEDEEEDNNIEPLAKKRLKSVLRQTPAKARFTNVPNTPVQPRANQFGSVHGSTLSVTPVMAHRQQGRPASVASSPPVSQRSRTRGLASVTSNKLEESRSSRERRYERVRAYNSEMKRIQKDLERASRRCLGVTDAPTSSQSRSGVMAAGSAGYYESARQSVNSYAVGEAQSVTRLAAFNASVLYRPVKDYSGVFGRGSKINRHDTKKASNPQPNWIVSSGPVFRLAKPFPVDVGNRDMSVRQNFEPSVFRFGLPQPVAAYTDVSADESTKINQKGRVRFNLPLTRNRADGNF